jgi:hypothetical protein
MFSGCLYGFAGGGLPAHIRTVAILPFDNQTGDAGITRDVSESVREALEDRLGLRIGAETQADAIVRGSISNYQADLPLSFQPTAAGAVSVTRRLVQIVVSVEIFDVAEERALWQRNGIRVEGEYSPPNEARGRELALERLVLDIVDGAQSQW